MRDRGGGRGGERVLGELHQPREQRARIVWRRLGQSFSLFSCLSCSRAAWFLLLAFVAVTFALALHHSSTASNGGSAKLWRGGGRARFWLIVFPSLEHFLIEMAKTNKASSVHH